MGAASRAEPFLFSSTAHGSQFTEDDMQAMTLTIRVSSADALRAVATISHGNLVLFVHMAAPHALRVHASIRPTAEGAAKPWLLALGPPIGAELLQILLLRGAPASWWLELGRVRDRVRVVVGGCIVIPGVEEPLRIIGENSVCEAVRILMSVGEVGEWRVKEDGGGVLRGWVHSERVGAGLIARRERGPGGGVWIDWKGGRLGDSDSREGRAKVGQAGKPALRRALWICRRRR